MIMSYSKFLLFSLAASICACNCTPENQKNDNTGNNGPDEPVVVAPKDVTAWVTTGDRRTSFEKSTFEFGKAGSMSPYQITYNQNETHQEIDGFGFAVTTASGYLLMHMSQADRTAFLKETFSREEGLGVSLIRIAIGASDFCLGDEYTYCDKAGLENFAVPAEDRQYLIPVLKEIYAINPDVKIIASPWSCPKWMKGGGSRGYEGYDPEILEKSYDSWTSGRLKPSCYQAYADYFVKWIQTMTAEGFDIYAMTMQNEPLNHGNSMSMYMPWRDQRDFIKVLGPTFGKAGIKTKILLFDHNFNYDNKEDQRNYPLNIYADPEAYRYAAGSAWHDYGGSVSELDNIMTAYLEKEIFFTEASIGTWNYDANGVVGGQFEKRLLEEFNNLFIGTMKRDGKGVTYWNIMLDQDRKPNSGHAGACTTCYGAVTLNSNNYKTITWNSQYYNVAHASSVIRQGAKRITHKAGFDLPGGMELQMFLNPDKTVGTVICNNSPTEQQLVFSSTKHTVKYTVPAKALVSLIWSEE